jgi:hypothetical protein
MNDRCGISLGFPDVPNYPEIKYNNSTDGKVYVETEKRMGGLPWWKIGRGFEMRCFTFGEKGLYVDGDGGGDTDGLERGQAYVWNSIVETYWRTL